MSELVLGLDLGTSGAKAGIYDRHGQLLNDCLVKAAYPLQTTGDGGVEADPVAIAHALVTVLDGVLEQLQDGSDRLVAVGFSTLASTLLGLDHQGHPLTPVYLYSDTRSRMVIPQLRDRLDGNAIHQRTGAPLHASYLPARLLWLRQTQGDVFAQVRHWLSIGEYFYLQWFGATACSYSIASWTGLLNRHTLAWDEELLAIAGLSPAHFSPLTDAQHCLHGLPREWAERWPSLAQIPWFLAMGDGVCNNIGAGCVSAHRVGMMIGSSGAMRVVLPAAEIQHVPEGLWCYRVDGDRALLGGATSEGGNFYAWLRQILRLGNDESELSEAIADIPPDGHGLTVLPFIAGERSPGWNDNARATILGLSLHTTPPEIARAGLEAIAYRFKLLCDRLLPYLPQDVEIIASGGALQRSPVWAQILADVLGRTIQLSGEIETSSRGVALLAFEHLGAVDNLATIPAKIQQTFTPNLQHYKIYRSGSDRQQRLYQQLHNLQFLSTQCDD